MPGAVPEGWTVVRVVGPVMGAVPEYCSDLVTKTAGRAMMNVPGAVPLGGTVETATGPVMELEPL